MKNKKKYISSFNLSFLDIMFCGFGAVVLLVLIINSQIVSDNKIKNETLFLELEQLKKESKISENYHQKLKKTLQESHESFKNLKQAHSIVKKNLTEIQKEKMNDQEKSLSLKKQINNLENEIKKIDIQNGEQKNKVEIAVKRSGDKLRQYEGDGHRQYLTGLKMGGKRVLFLIDSSASMLDETIVNIILKRNLSDKVKRNTRKWQQAIKSVQWMLANLPSSSQFLLLSFNTEVKSLSRDQSYTWIKSHETSKINDLYLQLNRLIPEKGTNLIQALSSIKTMSKQPDNIILITDGLPTQGNNKTNNTKITAEERIKLFKLAIKKIPKGIPVNTILLPMEGDPIAAALFWKLAIDTNGSFITPSRDWP